VDSITGERVWAGSELGLVDRIGSLDDAINEAAVLAK
jgi:protease-4